MKQWIAKYLQAANSCPDWIDKQRFYAIKARVLARWATPDGYDVQHIEGKRCFGCDGTGIYTGYHTYSGDEWQDYCYRCGGSGWWKSPVWVTLKRWRLADKVFHTPEERSAHPPEPDVTNITGYIEHKSHSFNAIRRAHLRIGLWFDWVYAARCVEHEACRYPAYQSTKQRLREWKRRRANRLQQAGCEDVPF